MARLLLLLLLLTLPLASPAQTKKGTASKKSVSATTAKPGGKSIKGLKNEQQQVKKEIATQKKKLASNEQDVQKRLRSLLVINSEIDTKKKSLDSLRSEINSLECEIENLNAEISRLEKQLEDRKDKYVKSMRYMNRNRNIQSKLMFIFSARNFSQMYRRMRFMREYATYQKAQGDAIKSQQEKLRQNKSRLAGAKAEMDVLLSRGEKEKQSLETQQKEQQNIVANLKKQQKTIKAIIEKQQKRDAALNAEIDRLVEIEVEKARMRAAEEARKQGKTNESASSTKAKSTQPSGEYKIDSEDRRISGSFESNKGKLPIPIAGSYKIVSHFGQYNVEGLTNVRLENKGVNIMGSKGAKVRSVFDGEVSAVFNTGGVIGVMVRHGSYISVYCNLSSVSVRKGQKVSTRQVLGTVGNDNTLQFQLRHEREKLNPETWLIR